MFHICYLACGCLQSKRGSVLSQRSFCARVFTKTLNHGSPQASIPLKYANIILALTSCFLRLVCDSKVALVEGLYIILSDS
jgi:hypothetical protein